MDSGFSAQNKTTLTRSEDVRAWAFYSHLKLYSARMDIILLHAVRIITSLLYQYAQQT